MPSCSHSRDSEGPSIEPPAELQVPSSHLGNPYATIESLQRGNSSLFATITALDVSTRLTAAHVRHVIIGGHAMAAHGRIRNTEDVDVIAVDMELAAACIANMHEGAAVHRAPGAMGCTVIAAEGRKLADVLNYYGGAAFKHAIDTAGMIEGVNVPSLEALMALKFEALSSATRPRDKRAMDLSDLMYLVANFRDQITSANIRSTIGDLVEGDSCGDPMRGKARWEAIYDAIISGAPISI